MARYVAGCSLLLTLTIPAPALSSPQECAVERISQHADGSDLDNSSYGTVISADGSWIAFTSRATDLIPGGSASSDVYILERATGAVALVSVSTAGIRGNANSSQPRISHDGRYVAFVSSANNLVPADSNAKQDVFVRDTQMSTTVRVSVSSAGVEANGLSGFAAIAPASTFVTFWSTADNLVAGDGNAVGDVFVHDLSTGITELVSVSTGGAQGNAESGESSVSADGRFVAFDSLANNLAPGDANTTGDCFLRDRWTNTTTLISVTPNGVSGTGGCGTPRISADGTAIAFWGAINDLVPLDNNGAWDVFVRDLSAGVTTRVSVSSDGTQGNGNSANGYLSASGRYVVFFSSASNLDPDDGNTRSDVFVHDRVTGDTHMITESDTGFPTDGDSFSTGEPTPDGRLIPLSSQASNLVSNDHNNREDAFVLDCVALSVRTYCTGKVNSLLCLPAIYWTGFASATDSAPFLIQARNVINNKAGIMFFGHASGNSPFQGGVLCVASPTVRTPVQNSAGSPPPSDCSGHYAFEFNALIQSGVDATLVPGALVYCQYWYRDPASGSTTGLTDGLRATILP